MAEERNDPSGRGHTMVTLRMSVGLLVFLVGIALLIFVFAQAYHLFDTVDDEIAAVGAHADNPGSSARGPTLGQVALGVGLQIGLLIALGFVSGLVATQGVRMISTHRE